MTEPDLRKSLGFEADRETMVKAAADLRATGMSWFRFTHTPSTGDVWLEAWSVRPQVEAEFKPEVISGPADIHVTKCETGPFKLPGDPDYGVWPAQWVGREAWK